MAWLGYRFHLRVTGGGELHCQRCGGDRPYRSCVGRRWLHVFFLPVMPLDHVAEHVQCVICGTRYRTEVLAVPTTEQMLAALPTGTRAAVAAMLRADDVSSGPARMSAIEAVRTVGLEMYDDAALDADIASATASSGTAATLGRLSVQLTTPADEWFLAGVVGVGLADGPLSDAERHAACEIAAFLGMTPAQAYKAIWMAEEAAAG